MKRSRTAALLLMSASPLLLTACGVEDVNTEGLYTSVDKCVEQTNDRYTCEEAFNQALAKAETDAPKYESREDCIAAHGEDQCQQRTTSTGHSYFMPMMTGFLLGQMLRGGQSAGLAGNPAYRDRAGNWQRPAPGAGGGIYRAGSAPAAMAPVSAKPNAAPTVSRGGFGSSSSNRSSSGG